MHLRGHGTGPTFTRGLGQLRWLRAPPALGTLTPTLQNGFYGHVPHPRDEGVRGRARRPLSHRAQLSPTRARGPEPRRAPTKTCRSGPLLRARGARSRQTQQPGGIQDLRWAPRHLPWDSASRPLHPEAGGGRGSVPVTHPLGPCPWAPAPLPCLIRSEAAAAICKRPVTGCSLHPWGHPSPGPPPACPLSGTVRCKEGSGGGPSAPAARPQATVAGAGGPACPRPGAHVPHL